MTVIITIFKKFQDTQHYHRNIYLCLGTASQYKNFMIHNIRPQFFIFRFTDFLFFSPPMLDMTVKVMSNIGGGKKNKNKKCFTVMSNTGRVKKRREMKGERVNQGQFFKFLYGLLQ